MGLLRDNIFISIEDSFRRVGEHSKAVEVAHEQLAISLKELETKDRVDISLKEYNDMKSRIGQLELYKSNVDAFVNELGGLFAQYHGITLEDMMNTVDKSTVKVSSCKDPMKYQTTYHILFKCDDFGR